MAQFSGLSTMTKKIYNFGPRLTSAPSSWTRKYAIAYTEMNGVKFSKLND